MTSEPPGPGIVGGHKQPLRRAVLGEPEPRRLADVIEAARAAHQAGKTEEARDTLRQELGRRVSPQPSGEADLERARAYTLLAILETATGEDARATDSAGQAITLLVEAAESGRVPERCQGDYGIALQIVGENESAIDVLNDARTIPTVVTPDLYRHLGLAYAATDQLESAEEWLNLAVTTLPGDVMARLAYGAVLAGQGREGEAAAALADGARNAAEVRPWVAVDLADAALELDERVDYLILKGDALRLDDQLDEALAVADEALAGDRESAPALALRGRTLYAQSKFEESIPNLREAVERDHTRLYACAELAYALWYTGDYREARDASDRALELARTADPPYVPQVLVQRGLIFLALDDAATALELADEVLAPDYVDPLYEALARGVKGYALAALDKTDKAVLELGIAARLEPDLADIYFDIAQLEQDRGRYDEAITALEEAAQHSATRRDEALGLQGAALIEAGRLKEAERVLQLAVKEYPKSALAASRLAEVLRQEGDFDAALVEIDRSLSLDDQVADSVGTRGQILASLGRVNEATEELHRAVVLDDDMAWAHAELGELLRVEGFPEDALTHIDRAIELAEDDARAWVFGSRGAALQSLGRTEEALEALNTALELNDSYGWAMGVKGTVLLDMGYVDEGIAELSRATSASPDLLWLRLELGFALLEARDAATAEGVFRRAHQLDPGNQLSAKGRAAALEDLDRLGEAIKVLKSARSTAFSDARTEDASDLLADIGQVYLLDGQFEPALEATIEALEEAPTLGAALSQGGEFLRRVAEFEPAAVVLLKGIEDGAVSLDYYRLGQVHERLLNWEAARSWYDKQLEIDPASLKGRRGLGESLLHLGDEAAAAEEFERVVNAVDRVSSTKLRVLTAAWCHYRLGNLPRAVRFFTDVIERDSEQMQSQMALGLLLFASGRMGPAIRQYVQAVSTLNMRKNPMHQRGVLVRAVTDFDDYLGEEGSPVDASILDEDPGEQAVPLTELMRSTDLGAVTVARALRGFLASSRADAELRYQEDWRPRLEPLLRHANGV